MDEQVVAIYFICDEVIKYFGCHEDPQSHMSTAEVMAFALIAALHHKANYRLTRLVSISCGYFRKILSLNPTCAPTSRLNIAELDKWKRKGRRACL